MTQPISDSQRTFCYVYFFLMKIYCPCMFVNSKWLRTRKFIRCFFFHSGPPVGPEPCRISCPSCRANITTSLRHESTTKTHVVALLLCLFGYANWLLLHILHEFDTNLNVHFFFVTYRTGAGHASAFHTALIHAATLITTAQIAMHSSARTAPKGHWNDHNYFEQFTFPMKWKLYRPSTDI